MASTAHKTEEELQEHFDAPDVLEKKVDKLVKLIKRSKHFTCFTGAGISTSTGISDFRGPEGVWTRSAKGLPPKKSVSTTKASPSAAHMSLVELMNKNYLKFLISSNCDGLHLRSGIDKSKFSELHGNTNIERCENCQKEFSRDEHVRDYRNHSHAHFTGRHCTECGGKLMDTIINFGENLFQKTVESAYSNARKSDLMLVLGSSLRVSTWAVDEVAENPNANLVIVNLQITPYDKSALVIHARTDTVLQMVMEKLNLKIPEWELHRRLEVSVVNPSSKSLELLVRGIDQFGNNYAFIPALQVSLDTKESFAFKNSSNLPYKINCNSKSTQATLTCHFVGNYSESPLTFSIPIQKIQTLKGSKTTYELYWNPTESKWRVESELENNSSASDEDTNRVDSNKLD